MFTREGVPVAGAMGDMGEARAENIWKIYLNTGDIATTLSAAEAEGAQIVLPAMPVADLGIQAVLNDPSGAYLGAWQAGIFPGFTVLNEHGAPSWFELHTRDYAAAVTFYRSVFGWDTNVIGDSDAFRYTTMKNPGGDAELAGIMDAAGFLPEGVPAHWSIYWEVDDIGASVTALEALGGSVVTPVEDTLHGRLATVADPVGAEFKLRTVNP
jgi:predicted enzyme related to lactoylglutathione lyase